jgi:hypothetical protein
MSKYIVYVDDIEGWQECEVINFYSNRAVVITSTGTQLDRIYKGKVEPRADRCIYKEV